MSLGFAPIAAVPISGAFLTSAAVFKHINTVWIEPDRRDVFVITDRRDAYVEPAGRHTHWLVDPRS